MSGFGVPRNDIATHVGVDPEVLRDHFTDELDRGSIEATAKVAQSLFNMATQGNNVAAAIFWMKARARWREKTQLELIGADHGPLRYQVIEDTRPPFREMLVAARERARISGEDDKSGHH
jgi:hypothetical protein